MGPSDVSRFSLRRMSACLALALSISSIYHIVRHLMLVANAPLENPSNRWARYRHSVQQSFCVRPYFYAGDHVSIRYVRNWRRTDEIYMGRHLPTDDPMLFDDDLTLVTHISASAFNAKYLSNLAINWPGPISYGVHVEGREDVTHLEDTIKEASRLLAGKADLSKLSVHVVIDLQPGFSCAESFALLPNITGAVANHASYPINVVRNLARVFSSSRYIASQDGDFFFSDKFYTRMRDALNRVGYNETEKVVYYYRIFEIEEEVVEAMNYTIAKPALKEIIDKDRGREFHLREWFEMHTVPMLLEWLRKPERTDNDIFYQFPILQRFHPYWEFQFVSARNIPYFDENFPYGLMDNLNLRWELCRANYTLTAVHDLFAYHGIQETTSDDEKKKKKAAKLAIREANHKQHYRAVRRFNQRMNIMYPRWMAEICPVYRYQH